MASRNVLFFTAANRPYEDFIPLYAYSVLAHVPQARAEFSVEDAVAFAESHGAALNVLERVFGKGLVTIREAPWHTAEGRKILPNSVRFLANPQTPSEYIYIGDVDIIILERDLVKAHLDHMARTGLPYSNSVRPGTTRLSGLHFSRTDAYYPLPDHSDLDVTRMNDEMLLHELVRRRGIDIPTNEWFRPVHGIHVSPNRPPMGSFDEPNEPLIPGWGISHYDREWKRFSARLRGDGFLTTLSRRIQDIVETIDAAVAFLQSIKPSVWDRSRGAPAHAKPEPKKS